MAIVPCIVCDHSSGCVYCKFSGFVENGEYLPPDQRPVDGVVAEAMWPEEETEPFGHAPWKESR